MNKISSAMIGLFLAFTLTAPVTAQDWDKGVSLFNQKQYRDSIREFHRLLKNNPTYWQAWFYVGSGHFQLKEYEETIDSFQNYVKGAAGREKEQANGYYYIGFSDFQLNQYDKAIPALTKYLTLSEKTQQKVEPSARAALGRAYIFSDKFAEAIPVLKAAAADMRTNASNFYYLGYAQHRLNRDDEAIASLAQALAVDARDPDTLALAGEIHFARARQKPAELKEAIATGERLRAVRNDERTWALLGQSYLADQQYAKAAPLLEQYAKAHADSAAAWFNLGVSLSRSEKWKPAEDALEQAVKINASNRAALLELGYVYESDKQYDKALATYQKVSDMTGGKDDTAKEAIARIKQRPPA